MRKSIFSEDLISFDPETVNTREEVSNTGDRLYVDAGISLGVTDKIISGNRKTDIEVLDRLVTARDTAGTAVDTAAAIGRSGLLDDIDIAAGRIANFTFHAARLRTDLNKNLNAALARIDEPPLTDVEKSRLNQKLNEGLADELRDPDSFDPDGCFLGDTLISMWPTGLSLESDSEGRYDDEAVLLSVWEKPISEIAIGDVVLSHDKEGNLKPGRVAQTFEKTPKHILDFWGTGVTPGHVYLCGEGRFQGQHVPLLDILRTDGAIVTANGDLIRASTGCDVGSMGDRLINAFVGSKQNDCQIKVSHAGQIRLGTRILLANGRDISVLDLIVASGGQVTKDGYIQSAEDGGKRRLWWTFSDQLPRPEDFVLQRSGVTLDEIYQANEWESIGSKLDAPFGAIGNGTAGTGYMQGTVEPASNVPRTFANHPDAPSLSGEQPLVTGAKRLTAA